MTIEKKENKVFMPSLFRGFRQSSCVAISWGEVFNIIIGDSLREQTERYRLFLRQNMEQDMKAVKSKMPCITPAVECSGGRRMEQITGYTGIVMCDFDHLPSAEKTKECMELLRKDAFVLGAHVTLSGLGIHIFCRAEDVTDYGNAWLQANEHYRQLLGFDYDKACKNPARLSALCHDKDAVYNPDANAMPVVRPKTPYQKKMTRIKAAKKYSTDARKAAPYIQRRLKDEGVTYMPGQRNTYISRALYLMNRLGVDENDAATWAASAFGDYDPAELAGVIKACYSDPLQHGTEKMPQQAKTSRSSIIPSQVVKYITTKAKLRHNVIKDEIEIAFLKKNGAAEPYHPLSDYDVNTLWIDMCDEYQCTVNVSMVQNAIMSVYTKKWNPFKEYFYGLPKWDRKTDHIDELADRVHLTDSSQQELFRLYFKKWLVAMLPGIFNEKEVNHQILVLVGKQGNYKSTFFNYLLPPVLKDYFLSKSDFGRMDKDDRLALAQFALICFDELDSMRQSDLAQLKALVTMNDIIERSAYRRNKEHHTHIASLCGCSNIIQFLTDPTGNRRWLVFEVDRIDPPQEQPINYTGVYSQAMHLWKNGFQYRFSGEDINRLNTHNTPYESPSIEKELIMTYLRKPNDGEPGELLSVTRIIELVSGGIRQNISTCRIGIALNTMGYEKRRKRGGSFYRVVILSAEEIKNKQRLDAIKALEEKDGCVSSDYDNDEPFF